MFMYSWLGESFPRQRNLKKKDGYISLRIYFFNFTCQKKHIINKNKGKRQIGKIFLYEER